MADTQITITLIQSDIAWKNIPLNLTTYSGILEKHVQNSDLVLLPEMFATGFTTSPFERAEDFDGTTVAWMKEISSRYHCAIAGSLIYKENNRYYNRLLHVSPSGHTESYDKRHLFRMEGEEVHFTPGGKRLISIVKGWRINFQICYDLRFPVWSRNRNDYDVLIYIANWPAPRNDVWNTLLKARALENQAYVIGVNRVGIDGNGILYTGESQVVDPKGNVMLHMGQEKNIAGTIKLSLNELQVFRKKFPVWLDQDKFTLE